MRAAVVPSLGAPLEVGELPVPEAGPGQVLVRIEASGVCHTDIHAARGDWPVKPAAPFVPGHEGVGRVVALGEGVSTPAVGSRVALAWLGSACGSCRYCVRRWLGAAGGSRPDPAAACTLVGPAGRRRRYEVVRAEVGPLRALAHRHGATSNDVVLVAVTAALRDLLAARGEAVDPIAVGVPVSMRRSTTAATLGNQVAPILVPAPVTGGVPQRLERVAATVRTARAAATRPPPAGVATAMWWAARVGLLRRYMTRQRRMHTMVSSVHGPDEPITVGGSTVVSIVPLVSAETGNVRVSFDVLSYAGTVTITAIADPDAVPDLPDLAAALRRELNAVAYTSTLR